jgi:hypothetical protein
MKKVLIAVIALLGLSAPAVTAAASIFFDDFNRTSSGTVGFGWSENPSGDVSIVTGGSTIFVGGSPNNAMQLRGNSRSCTSNCTNPDVVASHISIDTLVSPPYTGLRLSFDWKGTEFEGSIDLNPAGGMGPDALLVSWNTNGGSWNNLAPAISLTNNQWYHVSYDLPGGAIGSNNFGIRFASFVTTANEYVKIDNVLVTGETSVAAIPEPEIYAMMLAGLGLMGFVARRRRQQAAAV